MQHSIWLYPWDLVQQGSDAVLATLQAAELRSVDITLNYHSCRAVSWGNREQVMHHSLDGQAYFHADTARYGRLQPTVAPWIGDGEPVLEALDHLVAAGIQPRAWTIFGFNRTLGAAHPDLCGRNALGDPNPDALCPAHDEVRQYYAAMTDDLLANTPVAALSMEAIEYLPFGYHAAIDKSGWHIDPTVQWLLGLCFCDACMQRLPDAEAARSQAADWIQSYLHDLVSPNPMEVEEAYRPVMAARQAVVAEAVRAVADTARRHDREVDVILGGGPASCAWYGLDTAMISGHCEGYTVLAYADDPTEVGAQVDAWRRYTAAPIRAGLGLVNAESEEQLVDRARAASRHGASALCFYNYGLVPAKVRSWIAPALRAFANE